MNKHVQTYLEKYGIKDSPEMAEKGKLANDDSYFYRIDDDLQGWYIKDRTPSNDLESLIIDVLVNNYNSY